MDFLFLVFQLIILLFSVVIHEVSHGFVADYLGDDTARRAGRLTLNPLKHLDMFGSIILPLFFFLTRSPVILGWAKPVPYNPFMLSKDFKYGPLKVALAGPLANFIIALIFGLILRLALPILPLIAIPLIAFVVFLNILLGVFNLVPVPPLDGSKILTIILPPRYSFLVERFGFAGIILVLLLLFLFGNVIFYLTAALFNLIVGFPITNFL